MYDHVYPFVFLDSYQFFVYGSYQVYCGYAVRRKYDMVLPSFWGSTGIMLVAGGILYGIFLIFSGAGLLDGLLCLWLFGELTVTWNAMSYITAIKDYRGIMLSFTAAIVITFISGWVLLMLGIPHVEALLIAVAVGYGVMLLWDVILLYQYFPQGGKRVPSFS